MASNSRSSFMPPEPLPNSTKAKQLEAQELLESQTEEAGMNAEGQLKDMQKAQQDAVGQVQQAQQEIQKLQGELQNAQATSQQQASAAQMDAQAQIQKAQMDAQQKIQEERIKSQMKVLTMQEKFTKAQTSAKPNQNHILSNQLKRVTKKIQSLNKAAAIQIEPRKPAAVPDPSGDLNTAIQDNQTAINKSPTFNPLNPITTTAAYAQHDSAAAADTQSHQSLNKAMGSVDNFLAAQPAVDKGFADWDVQHKAKMDKINDPEYIKQLASDPAYQEEMNRVLGTGAPTAEAPPTAPAGPNAAVGNVGGGGPGMFMPPFNNQSPAAPTPPPAAPSQAGFTPTPGRANMTPEQRIADNKAQLQKAQDTLDTDAAGSSLGAHMNRNFNDWSLDPAGYNAANKDQFTKAVDTNYNPDNHGVLANAAMRGGAYMADGVANVFSRIGNNMFGSASNAGQGGMEIANAVGDGFSNAGANTMSRMRGYGAQLFNDKATREQAWNTMNSEIGARNSSHPSMDARMNKALGHFGTAARQGLSGVGEAAGLAVGGPAAKALGKAGYGAVKSGIGGLGASTALGTGAAMLAPQESPTTNYKRGSLNAQQLVRLLIKKAEITKSIPAVGTSPAEDPPAKYPVTPESPKASPINILQTTGYMGHNPERFASNFLAPQSQGYGAIGNFMKDILMKNFAPGLIPQPDIQRHQESLHAPTHPYKYQLA